MSSKEIIDVHALAKLARLEVSEEELTRLEREIPDILAFVQVIQKAATDISPPNPAHRNIMRADDNPHESGVYTERLLSAAPACEGNRVVVKQVISRQNPKSEIRNPKKS
ncbi:TPA: Asp-tRNA(Asn)/Glu-tRNA(Gln) amidotransferase GatCAB subunit C [Candidatus Kaiserbacteria bacterium]|nr:Asp-tRNA(Asn)/Glu-tRNA(Gln) amidotransferase GatCAB subunit C [Candidatus Kaiserbacteria bacterium]